MQNFPPSLLREKHYRDALKKQGKTPGENDIYHCGYEEDEVRRALAAGYRVPEDIAITGCDDTPEGQNLSPMLTTVTFPVYELGVRAIENLPALIRGSAPETAGPTASLLIRNSCGCHHKEDADTILLKFAYKNAKTLPECSFLKKNLLPDYLYDNSDYAFIYVPLYFEDKKFGYLVLAYENNQIDYQFRLVPWQTKSIEIMIIYLQVMPWNAVFCENMPSF